MSTQPAISSPVMPAVLPFTRPLAAVLVTTLLSCSSVFANVGETLHVSAETTDVDEPLGYSAKRQTTATKSNALLLDTPQFVSVIKREQLDNLPSQSVSQALRYSAGITSEKFGAFGQGIDFSKMRGFDADYYLDGLRILGNSGIWGPQIESWGVESIEAVHGPSSALYGQGSAGGVINMMSRRPSESEAHQLQFQMGNNKNRAIKFDSTAAIDDEGTWLYRLSGLAYSGESQIAASRQTRFFIAPAITWQPNERLNWTLLANYQRDPKLGHYNTLPASAVGLLPNPNGKLDVNRNYSNPQHENSSRTQYSVTSLLRYQLTSALTLTQNMRYFGVDMAIRRDFTRAFLPDATQLTAVYQDSPSKSDTFVMDNQLLYQFATRVLEHELLAGVDYQTGRMTKDWWGSQTVSFNPWGAQHYPEFTPYPVSFSSTKQTLHRYGVYLQDHLSWQQWHLMLSGRHDWAYLDTQDRLQGKEESTSDTAWSKRIGLNYRFDSGFSPWVSFADSFSPVLGTDAQGRPFVPSKATQAEVGVKYQNAYGDKLVSVALYELTEKNVTTHNPKNPDYYTQTGKVRSRGVEIESRLALTSRLNLLLNYTYTDNRITSSSDATVLNKHPVQVPKHSGSFWLDYRFQHPALYGAYLGAGVRYLGATQGDNTNTFTVPSVWLGDMSLRYPLAAISPELAGFELGLNVNNITNKSYVASCTSPLYCSIGADRTLSAVVNYYF